MAPFWGTIHKTFFIVTYELVQEASLSSLGALSIFFIVSLPFWEMAETLNGADRACQVQTLKPIGPICKLRKIKKCCGYGLLFNNMVTTWRSSELCVVGCRLRVFPSGGCRGPARVAGRIVVVCKGNKLQWPVL